MFSKVPCGVGQTVVGSGIELRAGDKRCLARLCCGAALNSGLSTLIVRRANEAKFAKGARVVLRVADNLESVRRRMLRKSGGSYRVV